LSAKWRSYRNGILNIDTIDKYINNLVDTLEPNITRNYHIWPVVGYYYHYSGLQNEGLTYSEEIEKWQSWLETRINWMDANIDNLYVPTDIPVLYSDNEKENAYLFCYPNPFKENLNLALKVTSQGKYKISIFDLTGKKLFEFNEGNINKGVFETELKLSQNLNRGVFVITIYRNNIPLVSRKIVKI
jgi:hypothetical protein